MAADIPPIPRDWPTFSIFAQIAVAFGQGSGHLPVSEAGIRSAAAYYVPRIEKNAGQWNEHAVVVLGLARIMGQLASAHAAARDRATVGAEDFTAAQEAIHRADAETMRLVGVCPWP